MVIGETRVGVKRKGEANAGDGSGCTTFKFITKDSVLVFGRAGIVAG
jgi:hypothetical protein